MTAWRCASVTLALVCAAGVARGQSLGQVAEKEAARRQGVAAGKQYTNDNLKPELRPAEAPPAAASAETGVTEPSPATPARPAPPTAPSTAESSAKPLVKEHRDEAYWRGRMRELRGHIQRLQGEINAMEARTETLGGDPGGAGELNVTQTALNRLRTNLRSFTQELEAFQARGRRANVPADWLQ